LPPGARQRALDVVVARLPAPVIDRLGLTGANGVGCPPGRAGQPRAGGPPGTGGRVAGGLGGGAGTATAASPWAQDAASPWEPLPDAPAVCNICRWTGAAFDGPAHSESAVCPRCGSVARDRFLFWCFVRRNRPWLGARLIETSPRLGEEYRAAMARWFFYKSSDFDERAHRGAVRLDLQDLDLPDDCLDVLLTPHVLEHVPDTDRALAEIWRVLARGGAMYLQVPVLQGRTAPPTEPEFHGDDTPVFWRFGYDLTERLRAAGFEVEVLVPEVWRRLAATGATAWPDGAVSGEFDVASMLNGVILEDLRSVASDAEAARIGAVPAYMFLTWECRKPR
jgi:SAM-dependent methyltransferase